jgi:hypothetical protein
MLPRLQVTLLQQLNTIRNQKAATRRDQRARQKAVRAKRAEAEETWRKQYNRCAALRCAVRRSPPACFADLHPHAPRF